MARHRSTTRSIRCASPLALAVHAGLAAGLVGLAGCQADPFSRDEALSRLVTTQSAAIGASAKPPVLNQSAADLSTSTQNDTAPTTVSPDPDTLRFQPAAEARNVTESLQRYAAQQGLQTSAAADGADGASPAAEEIPAAAARLVTLNGAFRIAQRSGRELLSAEETYLLSAISLLAERHLWGPRFFNDTTVGIGGAGDDGRFENATRLVNQLRVAQRLPYGGAVEAAWVVRATDQLRDQASGRYTQSSELVLRGNLPLLRGAGMVAREELIQAERNLIYAARSFELFRREYLVSVANDYFALLETRSRLSNQERRLEGLRLVDRSTRARVDAGRIEAFEASIASNEVVGAEADLASQRESYILQLERFKIRLGLSPEEPIAISEDVLTIPEPAVTLEDATALALEYQLDLQNLRDQLDDNRRRIANARNDLLPDLNLAASIGVPSEPGNRNAGLSLSEDNFNYDVSATLGLPLDREIERLNLRSTLIRYQQSVRAYEQLRDAVIVNVRAAVRAIDLSRFQLRLAEEQVRINQRRLRGQQLRADVLDTQALVDTQNALLNSENQRDSAVSSLRSAVLQYLLDSGQLRVAEDGTFRPLPGMDGLRPGADARAPEADAPAE